MTPEEKREYQKRYKKSKQYRFVKKRAQDRLNRLTKEFQVGASDEPSYEGIKAWWKRVKNMTWRNDMAGENRNIYYRTFSQHRRDKKGDQNAN